MWIYWKVNAYDLSISVPAATLEIEVSIWESIADPSWQVFLLFYLCESPILKFLFLILTTLFRTFYVMPMTLQLLASTFLLSSNLTFPIIDWAFFSSMSHSTLNFQNEFIIFILSNSLHHLMTSPTPGLFRLTQHTHTHSWAPRSSKNDSHTVRYCSGTLQAPEPLSSHCRPFFSHVFLETLTL